MKSEEEGCRAAGMDDFVPKPVDRALLFRTLRKWLTPQGLPIANKPAALTEGISQSPGSGKTSPTPAATISPTKLPGFNIEGAIKRLGVSQEAYLRMLGRFSSGQKQAIDDLQTALTVGDRETARRHAHSIAGAAGNLGAEALGKRGKALEIALKEGVAEVSDLLDAVLAEAKQVRIAVQGLSSETPTSKDSPTGQKKDKSWDASQILTILHTLKENLAAGDLDALSADLLGLDSGAPTGFQTQVKGLRDHIEGYEFEEATELVKNLLNQLKAT
jgi:HPt (histidine-containing phosphotransfer) domain-containing protein